MGVSEFTERQTGHSFFLIGLDIWKPALRPNYVTSNNVVDVKGGGETDVFATNMDVQLVKLGRKAAVKISAITQATAARWPFPISALSRKTKRVIRILWRILQFIVASRWIWSVPGWRIFFFRVLSESECYPKWYPVRMHFGNCSLVCTQVSFLLIYKTYYLQASQIIEL